MQAVGNLAAEDLGIRETVSGLRPPAEPRLAFDGGRATRVAYPQLADGAEGKGPRPGEAEPERDGEWRQRGACSPDQWVVCGLDPEGQVGEGEQGARHGAPLGVVGVEQRRRAEVPRRQGQLPAEVACVLDAG